MNFKSYRDRLGLAMMALGIFAGYFLREWKGYDPVLVAAIVTVFVVAFIAAIVAPEP